MVAIAGLVLGQMIPGTLTRVAMPAIFYKAGLDLESFWVFALPIVPVWFKWMWAPLVDSRWSPRLGRRRSWIAPCTLLASCGYLSLLLVQPTVEWVWAVAVILFAINVVMASQDVAVDGYTVDHIAPDQRELGATVIATAQVIGAVIGMSVLLALFDNLGWVPTVLTTAVLLPLCTLPALLLPEQAALKQHVTFGQALLRAVRNALARTEWPWIAGLMLAYGLAFNLIQVLLSPFLVDRGMSLTAIGLADGLGSGAGVALGSVLAAAAIRRFGTQRCLPWAVLMLGVSVLPWVLLAVRGDSVAPWEATAGMVVFGALVAPLYIVINAAQLAWAEGPQAGTDYSIQSALSHLGGAAAGAVAGTLAARWGWSGYFWFSAGVALAFGMAFAWGSRRVLALQQARVAALAPPGTAPAPQVLV